MRDHSDPTTGLGADVNINTRRKEERREAVVSKE